MVAPDPPTRLAAEATIATTIILTWIEPEDDGGSSITGYKIEKALNGAASAVLVADTGTTDVTYTDSTLTARDTAVYLVSAINGDGTSLASNSASATTSTSEAQTIKELLESNWALTGELSKSNDDDMSEVVNFLNRDQVPGNKAAKMVTVQKINDLGNESVIEHPRYFEQIDTFEITCFLQVPDSADDVFNDWIDLMQQMTGEVKKILRTVYAPTGNIGSFFKTNIDWFRDYTFEFDDTMLIRTLRFTLTKLVAAEPDVFIGYGAVLSFDTSESKGDSLPAVDFTYGEVTDIVSNEAYTVIPYLTKDVTNGVGVPHLSRGMFNGTFNATLFLEESALVGSSLDQLSSIYLPQANSPFAKQLGQIVFLQKNEDTTTVPTILTRTYSLIVNQLSIIDKNENLLTCKISGQLRKVTGFSAS